MTFSAPHSEIAWLMQGAILREIGSLSSSQVSNEKISLPLLDPSFHFVSGQNHCDRLSNKVGHCVPKVSGPNP